MTKQMIIAAAFAACSAFAQDAPPPPAPEAPSDAPEMQPPPERRGGHRHHAGGRDRQGPKRVQMKRIDPGIMIVGEELVLAKYDTDKDGKLSDEEIAVLQADVKKAQEAKKKFITAMDDDLNTPDALAAIFEFVKEINTLSDSADKASLQAAAEMFDELTGVLGLVYNRKTSAIPQEVTDLVAERAAAKKAKDWARADAIRAQLTEMGWSVADTAQGPQISKL